MTIDLHKWTFADREALMALCNAVDRTYLSDRLPYPYTEADADWWLGMVTENDGKEGVWRAIVVDNQIVGSISVERMADEQRNVGSIGYMILTPFWSQGIGAEAVRQICGIAFRDLALERIIGEVFPEKGEEVLIELFIGHGTGSGFAFLAHFQPHFREQFGVRDFRAFQDEIHKMILA